MIHVNAWLYGPKQVQCVHIGHATTAGALHLHFERDRLLGIHM